MRYDFYLPQYNRLIEFDGEQHYKNTNFFSTDLEEIQYKDRLKNDYAKCHNIDLIRIPYIERDKITLDLILGDKYLIKGD